MKDSHRDAEAARFRRRDATQEWRKWYKTKRWWRLRWSVLVRDTFTCRMCGRLDGNTSQLVCDHIEQHGGDEERFWSGPFQTLCKPCHDSTKQGYERGAARPTDIPRSRIPITIVCGPPASGKTHYVQEHWLDGDVLICLDTIMAELSGQHGHQADRRYLPLALARRNAMLRHLADDAEHKRAWFIVSAPEPEERKRWADMLGGSVVTIKADLATCLARIMADPTSEGRTQDRLNAASDWFKRATGVKWTPPKRAIAVDGWPAN
jgi:hypothetical protein